MLIYRHLVIMAYSEKLSDIIVLEKCEVNLQKNRYSFCFSLKLIQKMAIMTSKFELDLHFITFYPSLKFERYCCIFAKVIDRKPQIDNLG